MSPRRDNGKGDPKALDLSIWGIGDTELLAIVDDLADENGWTNSIDVRLQLGENVGVSSRRTGVGTRLGWMRRYGWLERSPDTGAWRITAMGHAILDNPNLSRAVESALDKLNPAQRVRLAREIGESGAHAPGEVRTALRRQWMRSLGR
jgi:hypothetical protein